jgi:hypothetical protein
MFWPNNGWLVYNLTSFPSLLIIFFNFFHNISYVTWITPSLNCRYLSMCARTSHWPYGYSPFTLRSWQRTYWNPLATPLPPLREMPTFTWDKDNYICFL